MYELVNAGEATWYIECPSKMGIYTPDGQHAYLIDSGNDKEAAKKALRHLETLGLTLAAVVNTHSNADHCGGNGFLQQRTGCKIISSELENAFMRSPILEPSFLYGGYPCAELRNKFLMAPPCLPDGTIDDMSPKGLAAMRLPGHYMDMIGLITSDGVCFIADSLFGEHILNKYHLPFVYDVREFLKTLDALERIDARLFIPSHAPVAEDIKPLVAANRSKVLEIIDCIETVCAEPVGFEEALKRVLDHFGQTLDFNQYVLVGSTLRSYLSYLHDEGRMNCLFAENRLLWQTVR